MIQVLPILSFDSSNFFLQGITDMRRSQKVFKRVHWYKFISDLIEGRTEAVTDCHMIASSHYHLRVPAHSLCCLLPWQQWGC